jgi:hypothetical protein
VAVTAQLSDGSRMFRIVPRTAHLVRLAKLARSRNATVTVAGLDAANDSGPAARVVLRG